MENPKSLFRRLFELALLAGMVLGLAWVFSVGLKTPQKTAEPAAVLAVESPYPPPATGTPIPTPTLEALLAYPPPYPVPGEALNPSPTPDYCTGMKNPWLTFTDPVAGYSISYPGDALLPPVSLNTPSTNYDYHSFEFNILTDCYDVECTGLNTIGISVYQNPTGLELQPFIEQKFELYDHPFSSEFLTNYEETGYFTQVGNEQSIKAFRVETGVTLDGGPDIFITNIDKVILIWASRTSKGITGPYDPPCVKTLEIMNAMLNTLVLSTPTQ